MLYVEREHDELICIDVGIEFAQITAYSLLYRALERAVLGRELAHSLEQEPFSVRVCLKSVFLLCILRILTVRPRGDLRHVLIQCKSPTLDCSFQSECSKLQRLSASSYDAL
jgi:hypothetical protein